MSRKTCASCGEAKAKSHFGKDSQKKDGLRAYCKVCMKAKYDPDKQKEIRQSSSRRNPESVLCHNAKQRAKTKGLPFNITPEDIDIPATCPVLGIPLVKGDKIHEGSPTLDRVIPELGYVRGNIRVISNRANRMKSNFLLEEFQRLVNYLKGHDGTDPIKLEVKMPFKPLSANKMHYANKKVDTAEYKRYKLAVFNALKKYRFEVKKDHKYKLSLIVGYSSKLSDLDNSFKPLLDAMQKVLSFDDRQIFEIEALKDHVPKGEEFIMVRLQTITDNQWKRRLKKLFPCFHKEK